ncbi:SigE family RNA polymerase sigma factor [Plantactinospora sp. WMMC1484]|uniref:SigE family RNA polymerase sigma factor n=1 Tax=Plantactinospora sp. WMMC1484 TaxID=3404122 RepID=UPI003BF4746A
MPEPESFDDFVRACSHRLYRVGCLLTGGDRNRAEDLVAEALARVYLAWPRVRAGDGFGYARRVMVNLQTDWWRGLRRRPETLTGDLPDVPGRPDHDVEFARRDSVVRALRQLTRRERAVVVLRYFLDLTEQDTAAELGVSLGTVKSTNARALAKLRVCPDLADPPSSDDRVPRAGAPARTRES